MKTYIACKIIQGEPCSSLDFYNTMLETINRVIDKPRDDEAGYKVVYPDGYISWSRKFAFENSHREILASELELLK